MSIRKLISKEISPLIHLEFILVREVSERRLQLYFLPI